MKAAVLRVAVPLLWPAAYGPTLLVAGTCFAAAFCIYLLRYAGWLMSPRVDGQDG